MPTTFLDLPGELRDEIYAYVFTGLKAAALPIYKLRHCPNWLVRSHTGIFCPPILQTCKLCFLEAYPIFIRQVGTPLLRIDHPRLVEVSCVPNQPAPRYWWTEKLPLGRSVTPEMRPLVTSLLPILLSVPSLRIEIVVPEGKWMITEIETTRIVALLHWVRAVLAARGETSTSSRQFGCLLIVLRLPIDQSAACHLTLQLLQRATHFFAAACWELRVEQRWGHGGRKEGAVVSEYKRGREEGRRGGEGWRGVEKAWKEMLESCKERSYYWRCAWQDFRALLPDLRVWEGDWA